MGILDEDVSRVRDQTDLVALVGDYVALKRVGQRFAGLCPFHQEKSPSFSVNAELGVYYCFGCQSSGDAITFLREIEHLDFPETIERLATRAGITLRYDDKSHQRDKSRRSRLVEAVEAAVVFYHQLLVESPAGGAARKYLRGRGFGGDEARQFRLGFSPEGWDDLSKTLSHDNKFSRDDLVEAGLAFVNKANRLQDQFRGRLMFPIFDARGEAVGFGARDLVGEGPKYRNSAESAVYQKSRLLYGLNWAKPEIVARSEVIICEGYTDVMAYSLAGAPNAVATCGTALSEDHVRMLKNLTRRVVLAYDADSAGQGAAERWYKWEQELELEVRVAGLPLGRDPGDLWRDDQPALLASITEAKPFLAFRIDRALAAGDVSTIEGRARAATMAARVIAEHPSELVRDQYALQISESLSLDLDGVRHQITQARTNPIPASAPGRPIANQENEDESPLPPPPVDRREVDILRWVIHDPALVQDWIDASLFIDPTAREVFDLLIEHPDLHEAIAVSDGNARRLLERLAVEEPEVDDEPQTLAARLMVNTVEPVAKRLTDRALRSGDDRASEAKSQLDSLAHARELGEWVSAQNSAKELLRWVIKESARLNEPAGSVE